MYVPSTPASRGEPEPDLVDETPEPEAEDDGDKGTGAGQVRVTEPADVPNLPPAKKTTAPRQSDAPKGK